LTPPLSSQDLATIRSIKHIVLPLGPYRNLTTLIGAVISLHPQGLALNHAAARILPDEEINFLGSCTREAQRRFLEVAVPLLQEGVRGKHGGSILKSHAFDDPVMREAYKQRYGNRVLKETPPLALYWKDSNRVYNYLLAKRDGIPSVVRAFDNVKFVLPIRNPIHCAKSNLASDHWTHVVGDATPTFGCVLAKILSMIRDIATNPSLSPDRLLVIWEWELPRAALSAISDFLELQRDPWWMNTAGTCVKIREREATSEEKAIYAREVDLQFGGLPDIRERLLRFLDA